MAELEKLSQLAVKYADLIWIAAYADYPSTAYAAAENLGWYKHKVASCRFLSIIRRDYGDDAFWSFVERSNPDAFAEICRCNCHGGYDLDWFTDPESHDCDCCGFICLAAAHTFNEECWICANNQEAEEDQEWDEDQGEQEQISCENCEGNACDDCECRDCDPDECETYRSGHCEGHNCFNCGCFGCYGRPEEAQSDAEQVVPAPAVAVPSPSPTTIPPVIVQASSYTPQAERVEMVACRLFGAVGQSYPIQLMESTEFGGGADDESIILTTAAVDDCNDDELAVLIGHELAHNLKGHPTDAMKRNLILIHGVRHSIRCEGFLVAIGLAAVGHLINRKRDRDDEFEADELSIELARRAGFNVARGAKLFERLKGEGGWLSTHPSTQRRVENIQSKRR